MSATSIRPSIHILGAGSIGQLWAISLRSKIPSYPVSLILRAKGNDPGPTTTTTHQTFLWKYPDWEIPREVTIPVVYNAGGDDLSRIETLLVTTKSYQAKDAIASVLHRCSPSRIVLLCNGALSVREEVLPILKDDTKIPLILATTTHGAYRDATINNNGNKSCLVHAGIGKTFIEDQASDLSVLWNEVGLNCSTLTESEMDQLLWKKLAANCVINPLTALFRCSNGELWMEPSFFELQQEILHEIAQVAKASLEIRGTTTSTSTSLDEASLRKFVGQVIQDTQENKSSMLQDVLQKRKTEIDHLNNYVVQKGRSLGIACPMNEELVERIQALRVAQESAVVEAITPSPPTTSGTLSTSTDHDRNYDLTVSEFDIPDPFPLDTSSSQHSSSPSDDFHQNDNYTNSNTVDQELLAALISLGIDGDDEPSSTRHHENWDNEITSYEPLDDLLTGALSSSPLPDIEVDFGDDDASNNNNFFTDFDQLDHIFDPEIEESPDFGGFHLVDDPDTAARVDQDTEALYQELANLTLHTSEPARTMDPTSPAEDGLPPYLYCQPCTPDAELFDPFSPWLASIGEEEPLENMQINRRSNLVAAAEELRELLDEDPSAVSLLRLDEDDQLIQQFESHGDIRPEAFAAATPFVEAFGLVDLAESDNSSNIPSQQKSCYAHRETIFGVTFSECGQFCASASQDSTICIWHVPTNTLVAQLKEHSKDYECLRVAWASERWSSETLVRANGFEHMVASSGADGVVKLWACTDPLQRKNDWKCVYTLDHSSLAIRQKSKSTTTSKEEKTQNDGAGYEMDTNSKTDDDKPQTYTLQFIDHWQAFNSAQSQVNTQNSFIMTSSDEFIHFWEVVTTQPEHSIELLEDNKIRMMPDKISLKEVMSLHFDSIESQGFGVTVCTVTESGLPLPPPPSRSGLANGEVSAFGGPRNPENKVYVFDAMYCKANGLLGAALSDGSLRLINGRGICISILNLPGCQSHLTSFCWDSTGTKLATSVATGHLITWKLDVGDVQGRGRTVAACTAIMEGGHQLGRPLFGSRYCGKDENLIVSWCIDGTLCLWDSYSTGNVHAPIAVLKSDPEYPIYAVELSNDTIAVGGGTDGGFVGIPLYLYTIGRAEDKATARAPNPKRSTKSIPNTEITEKSTPEKKSKTDHDSMT